MSRPALKDGLSKQARYRAAKKAAGLKEVRFWVPDRNNTEFMARLKRDMAAVRSSESEAEVMAFVEAAAEWPPYEG